MWKPGCRPFQYSLVKLHRPIIDVDQMHKEGGANRLLCPWRRQRRWMTDMPRARYMMPCYQSVSIWIDVQYRFKIMTDHELYETYIFWTFLISHRGNISPSLPLCLGGFTKFTCCSYLDLSLKWQLCHYCFRGRETRVKSGCPVSHLPRSTTPVCSRMCLWLSQVLSVEFDLCTTILQ